MSETQLYARLRSQDFKSRYDEARRELLEQATAALQGHLAGAVETMGELCRNAETPAQTRLNAADSIIRNTLKLVETTDILARLCELEKQMEEGHA